MSDTRAQLSKGATSYNVITVCAVLMAACVPPVVTGEAK